MGFIEINRSQLSLIGERAKIKFGQMGSTRSVWDPGGNRECVAGGRMRSFHVKAYIFNGKDVNQIKGKMTKMYTRLAACLVGTIQVFAARSGVWMDCH